MSRVSTMTISTMVNLQRSYDIGGLKLSSGNPNPLKTGIGVVILRQLTLEIASNRPISVLNICGTTDIPSVSIIFILR